MSYVRHVWVNDEDITDDKLNNIEVGVQEAKAGGEKHVYVSLSAGGLGSFSKTFGWFVYAWRDAEEDYFVVNDDQFILDGGYLQIDGTATPNMSMTPPMPMPPNSDIGLFFVCSSPAWDEIITTGDVVLFGEGLYYSYGSPIVATTYRIGGNGSMRFASD